MKRKMNIHLYVTDKCNLNCSHCYNAEWINKEQVKKHLSLEEIIYIINLLYKKYDVDFHIEGGETFLWEHIYDLLNNIDDNILKTVTLTTNGTINLLSYTQQLEKVNNLRFSVCGHTDELQKKIRNIPLKPILDNIQPLVDHNIPINIRMTLHKGNFDKILDGIDFFVNKRLFNISIYEFQNVGRGSLFESLLSMSDSDFQIFLELLEKNLSWKKLNNFRINLNKLRIPAINSHINDLQAKGFKIKKLETEHSLTINYNGDIGICPWSIGGDTIAEFDINSFDSQIENLYKTNSFLHSCDHCSAISIFK
ncbi:radical SAM protein [Bacteroides sp. 519]|uniref:radical SAM protein n=1 Tax=Bacteroides sp. 519 TaxID=2302937 RepID=UPI0013D8DB6E|nr:radical SAM protein [Bacteroides sp. 519]NDV57977.1 radical SAM protein [Bacteroides sp. 519]